ncbi:PREDICTED: T-cell immunomodulatory protein [Nicrophorus vespilloides]|uniref:T-cell immunomodulatory protein n=1 Tax=Nicrophorus vespilloides TaxID=110193 RepID=A0ABM1MM96_NICVS|nr:PREDICTED: T-cell immunomodulatory protein [Nicrophorus vespilloides]
MEFAVFVHFLALLVGGFCSDITQNVFGNVVDGMPAAFGDFNSDELTDVFVLRDKGKTVEILLSAEEEPLLRPAKSLKCSYKGQITSVVPGDFDGDAFMDVLVTTMERGSNTGLTHIHINWGGAHQLNCSNESVPILKITGQPLAIDYNQDMIIDLFGMDEHKQRMFWIFNNNRTAPMQIPMDGSHVELNNPHAHAFLDLNDDNTADLFLTTKDNFEVWFGHEKPQKEFVFGYSFDHPKDIGQPMFIDIELRGRMDLLAPVCYDKECKNSTLLVYCDNSWHNLQVDFKDPNKDVWMFYRKGTIYTNLITLRSGDFNMDGYPDLLATLSKTPDGEPQTFMLENVACITGCGNFTRTYAIQWNALSPFKGGTVLGVFFDFFQDGILDVILVQKNGSEYKPVAFKNSLDYDANFIKVMVLTGLNNNKNNPMIMGRVGKKRRTYGTNLPGPKVAYSTTTQEGNRRHAVSAQLPQSAHFSLNLPYNIFGLGRAPNFVENVTVGLSNNSRLWTQIIPNSQIVVIPWPTDQPAKWKAQLFVTPSKLILTSVGALTGVCVLITIIIGVLHWKERQDDKKERLSESHRFHFDAM